jgi:uncharacterized protein
MVERKQIEEFASEIARQFSPEKIILFGSHARMTATEDSDVDILVMMNFEGRGVQKAIEIRKATHHPFSLDLLVRRPDEVAWRVANRDYFLQDVLKEGVLLYATSDD